MDLTPRKQDILSSIVNIYIENGEPVGSKLLCEIIGNVSSATIRNEMSDLVIMGLLDQPHTSAGRVPTAAGLHYYVRNLLGKCTINPSDKYLIDSILPIIASKDNMLEAAAGALAEITHCASLITSEADHSTRIHTVELVPISTRTVILILITSAGNVISKKLHLKEALTEEGAASFIKEAKALLSGTELLAFNGSQTGKRIMSVLGEYAYEAAPLVSALNALINEAGSAEMKLNGQSNLMCYGGMSPITAREIFDLMSRRQTIMKLLNDCSSDHAGVIFGDETGYSVLGSSSIIAARYRLGGGTHFGYVGIIGPRRMNYERMIPCVEYFARGLGAIMNGRE